MKNINELNVNLDMSEYMKNGFAVNYSNVKDGLISDCCGSYKNVLFTGELDKFANDVELTQTEYLNKGYLVSKQIDSDHNSQLIKAGLCDILYVFNCDDFLTTNVVSQVETAIENNTNVVFHSRLNLPLSDFKEDEKIILEAFLNKYKQISTKRMNDKIYIYDEKDVEVSNIMVNGDEDFEPIRKFFKYEILDEGGEDNE